MKKKLLFIDKSFATGGIQTSMLNMIAELKDIYDIDLYIYNAEGPLKSRLPEGIGIIKSSWRFEAIGMSLAECIKKGSLKQMAFRIFASAWTKLFNNRLPIAIALKNQEKLIGYDVAIAFHHEASSKSVTSGFARFADRCTDARLKLAWIHYDPDAVKFDEKFADEFYSKMDKIVCVSRSVADKFTKYHVGLAPKIEYCYNFLDYGKIYALSEKSPEYRFDLDGVVLFSACRLSKEKALPRGIKAAASVLREHCNVRWYIAGDGPERKEIEKVICDEGLEDKVILLGNLTNPYSYMKYADILMVVSYHEAAPMVYMEAKALSLKVFTTRISSAEEMLEDGTNAYICENSEEGIRSKLAELLADTDTILKNRAARIINRADNSDSIKKINEMIGMEK